MPNGGPHGVHDPPPPPLWEQVKDLQEHSRALAREKREQEVELKTLRIENAKLKILLAEKTLKGG
jgi:hypothetical protein